MTDDLMRDSFRDNLIGYTDVLKQGKYTLEGYVNAIKYVTYKLADHSNLEAFIKAMPDKYNRMVRDGYEAKNINAFITTYSKGKMITALFDMTAVPSHILNADIRQKAINRLAYLMMNAHSEKVQSDSAAKLVDSLKPPETAKIELDINVKEDSAISDLRNSTMELVKQQKAIIEAGGMTAKEVAHQKLVQEYKEDEDVIEGEVVD